MNRRGKIIAAFSVSPLASAVPVTAFYLPVALSEGLGTSLGFLVVMLAIVVVCGYAAILVLGIPLYIVYRRKGIDSVWAYIFGAFLIGVVSSILITAPFSYSGTSPTWALMLLSGLAGACAGLVFWFFVKGPPNNPLDRDAQQARAA